MTPNATFEKVAPNNPFEKVAPNNPFEILLIKYFNYDFVINNLYFKA
jgi:hypothetical protein